MVGKLQFIRDDMISIRYQIKLEKLLCCPYYRNYSENNQVLPDIQLDMVSCWWDQLVVGKLQFLTDDMRLY